VIDLTKLSRIDIETINNCNAKCPLCLRGEEGMNTNDRLDWAVITKNIPDVVWSTVKEINFNGTTGDNIMHPDIFNILSDVKSKTTGQIVVSTNGSLRSKEWWHQLGVLFAGTDHKVTFGIDGLEDTHKIYRVNTDYNKIIENAKAFIAGGGRAEWQFILFDHNSHQVDACKEIAYNLGFSKFFIFYQDRFDDSGMTSTVQLYKKDLTPYRDDLIIKDTSQNFNKKLASNYKTIDCHSLKVNWFSIYADGTVWPCCWLMGWHKATHQKQFPAINYHFKKMLKLDFNQMSLYNNKLEDIIAGEIWQKNFKSSFATMPNPVCIQQCSK
jgi:MoaA/NifB/PqqE/SkfB family radical SAM enzyme